MKKFLAIAISTLMVGSLLIGCGEEDVVTTTEAAVETTEADNSTPNIDVELEYDTEEESELLDEVETEEATDVVDVNDAEETTVA